MSCDNIDAKSSICGISTLIVYKTFLFANKAERTDAQLTLKVKVVKMKGPKSLLRVTTLKVNVTKLTWSRTMPWATTEKVTQSKCPVTLPNRSVPTRNPRRFMRLTSMWTCLILKVRSWSFTLLCIYILELRVLRAYMNYIPRERPMFFRTKCKKSITRQPGCSQYSRFSNFNASWTELKTAQLTAHNLPLVILKYTLISSKITQIAKFLGPTWGPPGSCRPQMGPMLATWTLLSGDVTCLCIITPRQQCGLTQRWPSVDTAVLTLRQRCPSKDVWLYQDRNMLWYSIDFQYITAPYNTALYRAQQRQR